MKLENEKIDNVVSFPFGGKDSRVEMFNLPEGQEIDDPLRDLLEEFDHVESDLETLESDSLDYCDSGPSTIEGHLKEDFTASRNMTDMLKQLEQVQKRIHYYMDEVELFIPRKKK